MPQINDSHAERFFRNWYWESQNKGLIGGLNHIELAINISPCSWCAAALAKLPDRFARSIAWDEIYVRYDEKGYLYENCTTKDDVDELVAKKWTVSGPIPTLTNERKTLNRRVALYEKLPYAILGIRHQLPPVVSVLVAGAACGYRGPLAIAEAAGWDQELLAAHGCRISPATGLRVAPSARTLYRVAEGLDADELEAALTAALANRRWTRRSRPRPPRGGRKNGNRRRKSEAEAAGRWKLRAERGDGWFRPHPLHPWLDPAVTGDPGHVPARHGVAVDGKERKGAKAGGREEGAWKTRPRYGPPSPTSSSASSAYTE